MTNETQAWASRYFGVRPYNLTQEQLDFAQRALDMGLDYTLDLPRKPVNLPQPVYIDCDNGMNWYIVPVALANNLRLAIEEQGFLGEDWKKYRTDDDDYPHVGLYAVINQ
jgi:hypothetical protein